MDKALWTEFPRVVVGVTSRGPSDQRCTHDTGAEQLLPDRAEIPVGHEVQEIPGQRKSAVDGHHETVPSPAAERARAERRGGVELVADEGPLAAPTDSESGRCRAGRG
ncbi:hypothetical protein AB0F91_40155 [Amycolatopsis sp. NPDC023774]|uniref:hypothetical protein n=1 Tax=Amycolatopsis sp. NPDC023774 TaxID=3155015 RepID=UPI0033FD55B4